VNGGIPKRFRFNDSSLPKDLPSPLECFIFFANVESCRATQRAPAAGAAGGEVLN
jgi:hypothetical protein